MRLPGRRSVVGSAAGGLRRSDMTSRRKLGFDARSTLWPNGSSAQPLPSGRRGAGRPGPRTGRQDAAAGDARSCCARAANATASIARPAMAWPATATAMIVQRGFPAPPSYHTARLRAAPAQHFYDVITTAMASCIPTRPRRAARPLGHRRLYPGAADLPRRGAGRGAGRTGKPAVMAPPLLWLRAQSWRAAGLGMLAAVLLLAWAVLAPSQAIAAGWLIGFLFWLGIAVGALTLLAIHALTGGRWGLAARPALRARGGHAARSSGCSACRWSWHCRACSPG